MSWDPPLSLRGFVICLLVLGLSGCSNSSSHGTARSEPGVASRPRLSIDWLGNGDLDAYHCSMLNGARQAAQQAGVDLTVQDRSGLTWEQQNVSVERAVNARANAIVLEPVDYPPTEMTVRGAHDQEEHVVLVDVPPVPNPGLAWAFVNPDESAVGRLAAQELTELAGGGGQTLLVASSGTAASWSNTGQITLELAGATDTEVATLSSMLVSHPEITGIFAADDAVVAPVIQVLSRLSRPLPVVAAGAEPDEVGLLLARRIAALVVIPGATIGRIAVGDAIAAATSRPVADQTVPPVLVTRTNLDAAGPGCDAG